MSLWKTIYIAKTIVQPHASQFRSRQTEFLIFSIFASSFLCIKSFHDVSKYRVFNNRKINYNPMRVELQGFGDERMKVIVKNVIFSHWVEYNLNHPVYSPLNARVLNKYPAVTWLQQWEPAVPYCSVTPLIICSSIVFILVTAANTASCIL